MDFQVPCGIFFSRIPHGKVMAGTEDAKMIAIPNSGLRPLICSIPSRGEGIVSTTTDLQTPGNRLFINLRIVLPKSRLSLRMR